MLIYSKLYSQSCYYLYTKSLSQAVKSNWRFHAVSHFIPANRSEKINTSKGEGGKADFKATKFHFSLITYQGIFPKNVFNSNITNKQCSSCFDRCQNLICLLWLVDKLHFLSCYFSFLNCSVTMPVSSVEPAATYTPFTKWYSRATLTSRSRLHRVLRNAERLVLLISDVKATTSLCSLQYAN